VRQLLAHQAGLYVLDEPIDRRLVTDFDRLSAVLARQKIHGGQFSLGFMKSTPVIPFGGARSFGSPGAGGAFGFADPDAGAGYGYVTNRRRASAGIRATWRCETPSPRRCGGLDIYFSLI
jgi:CubicO group peptidase (beta-lactamase class C family)